jgi:signal transduction histidine kinase
MEPQVTNAGVALILADLSAVQPVTADPVKIRQSVLNILSNAVKFTPTGGEVHLSVDRAEATFAIVVRDTGPG